MIINKKMKSIIDYITLENISATECYQIEEEKNINGNPFWCVKDAFCVKKENVKKSGDELTDLEWNGNEIYVSSSDDLIELLEEALGIMKQWEYQMRTEYKDICFEIVISIDEGDEDITPSATIRFYAVREDYHVVNWEQINEYINPVLIEKIGDYIAVN